MNQNNLYKTIKEVVQNSIPGSRVLLFGSRARGDNSQNSDYDLLVITPDTYSSTEKIYWRTKLDNAITSTAKIPIDLLFNSEEEVKIKKELPGDIIRSVLREAVIL
jgi:uncharacterized protein